MRYLMIEVDELSGRGEFRGAIEADDSNEACGRFKGCADAFTDDEVNARWQRPSYLRRGDVMEPVEQ